MGELSGNIDDEQQVSSLGVLSLTPSILLL
jgi:hypothetical protein